ncbi:MAG TPA: SpoIVB peptidase S55 domain-containing protein, partial [Candidatus Didemnitutus sp.]|nr:SpoIVB peptidase S55 domain-containing protein [Candidatus Didemnitutus sp.]
MNLRPRNQISSALRLSASLLLFGLLSSILPALPVDAPVMPLEDLKPGQTGEVWTVFKGSQSEPFKVEVTGVIRNALGPGKNLILCELTDPRVQKMGAVAGMSGSPLYIDGKLVGVLSYQIQRFETVRYAGFTPISDMLEVSALPSPLTPPATALPIPVKGPRNGRSDLALDAGSDVRALTPVFSVGGITPQVAAMLEPQFSALGLGATALGGHADGEDASVVSTPPNGDLKPGDVVAAALAVGDISIAATGTVSHVDGKRILAFGHPMLSLGATELPMASAEVVTILPSQLNSVKISNTGQIIGAFSQDRLSGIYGEIGKQPHLVPIDIELPARLNRRSMHFSVVRQEQILPAIAAAGIAQAVTGSNEAGLTNGFRLTTTVEFPGEAPVEFSQIYPGAQGFAQGVGEFTSSLQQWLFNPYTRTFPEHIRFAVEETPQVPVGYVEVMQVSRTEASPDSAVTVAIKWHGFQDGSSTETATIPVPAEWAGKDLDIVLATGPALDEMTGRSKSVQVSQLRNFDEYLNFLRTRRDTDGLYLAVLERTRIFSDQRVTTADLPGSLERIARGSDETRYQRRDA